VTAPPEIVRLRFSISKFIPLITAGCDVPAVTIGGVIDRVKGQNVQGGEFVDCPYTRKPGSS
jgi:hypothetical protein